jgi:S1-C subfamily serine protease
MFADAIKSTVHPATWAVIGTKRDANGNLLTGHRGTAFAIDTKGHLLTCWHVTYTDDTFTEECETLHVMQPQLGTPQYDATVVAKEKDRDLAVLKITQDVRTKPVTLLNKLVPFGRSCCAFGHALSAIDQASQSMRIFSRASAGIVSMPYDAGRFPGTRAVSLYELDFFTHGGSSGGPIFLRDGSVFAVVSGSLLIDDGNGKKARSNLSVSIDVREAIQFLQPLNIKAQVRGSG